MQSTRAPQSTRARRLALVAAPLAPLVLALAAAAAAPAVAAEPTAAVVSPVLATGLPNVPGKNLTAVVVRYAPGAASASHHHAGSVFVYVLSGTIRSQVSTGGPVRDYRPGESFFEPPGSDHLVSANASATEPASLLAVFVADDGAVLTTLNK
jgi:quercetin dioxygenase-like cupin family protein